MNATLSRLLNKLEDGSLLAAPLLEPLEIEAALDARNEERFEGEWLRLHEQLSEVENADEVTESKLKRIRELAFKAAYRGSDNPDFAGYVSDDFDLVARAVIADKHDAWLSGLFAEYLAGRFPSEQVRPMHIPLVDMI